MSQIARLGFHLCPLWRGDAPRREAPKLFTSPLWFASTTGRLWTHKIRGQYQTSGSDISVYHRLIWIDIYGVLSRLASSVSAEDTFLQEKMALFDLKCLQSARPASCLVFASLWLRGDMKKKEAVLISALCESIFPSFSLEKHDLINIFICLLFKKACAAAAFFLFSLGFTQLVFVMK